MEAKKPDTKLISLGVLVAVVLLVVAVAALNKKEARSKVVSAPIVPVQTTMMPDTATMPASSSMGMMSTHYKAGTYTSEGTYFTPDGDESIKISLTLSADGTITATAATAQSISHDSKEYQDRFIRGYKSQVVGRSINGLSLGNISGASLTPIGFNKAALSIKSQATNS